MAHGPLQPASPKALKIGTWQAAHSHLPLIVASHSQIRLYRQHFSSSLLLNSFCIDKSGDWAGRLCEHPAMSSPLIRATAQNHRGHPSSLPISEPGSANKQHLASEVAQRKAPDRASCLLSPCFSLNQQFATVFGAALTAFVPGATQGSHLWGQERCGRRDKPVWSRPRIARTRRWASAGAQPAQTIGPDPAGQGPCPTAGTPRSPRPAVARNLHTQSPVWPVQSYMESALLNYICNTLQKQHPECPTLANMM